MRSPRHRALLALLFLGTCLSASAETGFLVVHVEDVNGHPVRGVLIGVKGDGGSDTSDPNGKVRIRLAPQTKAADWVTLDILHSPPGQDLVLLSPSDSRAVVPSFENKSDNFVDVVVVGYGDLEALKNFSAGRPLTENIIKGHAPKTADKQAAEDPKANLNAVAKQFGVTPEDLDNAIRAWGAKTTDPYDVGLAALYARHYDTATSSLKDSLKQREEKFATAQKDVADAAFFLGQSLYEQGRYKESAAAFQRCLEIRGDDARLLNNTALSLKLAGEYASAEPLYRRALAIGEKTLGPDNPNVATGLSNLGALLQAEGDYAGAEPLYQRALTIHERAFGPDHPSVATDLNNLGLLLEANGNYPGAESLYRQALAIDEKALGPDHPDVARDLNNVAGILYKTGDAAGAKRLVLRALSIDQKASGPDHPNVATDLNNLALLLCAKGDYAAAEPLLRRALAIDQKALGPDHPTTRRAKSNLDDLLKKEAQTSPPKPQH